MRVVASAILYGLTKRSRSSRVLEYRTGQNVDFLGLTEGRTPEARSRYARRFHDGETPFGWLKHVLEKMTDHSARQRIRRARRD